MVALREADLSKLVPANQLALAQQQLATYWGYPWPMTLFGALERFFTIPTQIAFAVIVLQAFTRKQPGWVALAVLWHATADGVMVYLARLWAPYPWVNYAVEGVIALFALVSVIILFALRQPEPPEPEPVLPTPPAPEPPAIQPEPPPLSHEKLDDSRYV